MYCIHNALCELIPQTYELKNHHLHLVMDGPRFDLVGSLFIQNELRSSTPLHGVNYSPSCFLYSGSVGYCSLGLRGAGRSLPRQTQGGRVPAGSLGDNIP